MKHIKKLINNYFENFSYFYSHLGYRVFVVVVLSIFLGIVDGLGLSMFLPLLQMVNDKSSVDSSSLGRLDFLVEIFENLGIPMTLISILLIMIFFFILKGIFQYTVGVYKVFIRQRFIEKVRLENIRDLNNLDYKYFVGADVGRIQNTLSGEVDKVAQAFQNYFLAMQYSILVLTYMGFAFMVNTQFALLVSVGGGITNFFYRGLYKKTKGSSVELTGENNYFQSLIIQNVGNYKYLKATGMLQKYGAKLTESVKRIKKNNIKIGLLDTVLTAAREPMLITIVAAVIYIQTSILGSPLGPILISLLFFYRALINLMQMQIRWNLFLGLSGSLKNMDAFSKELRSHKEKNGDKSIAKFDSENKDFIRLNDVKFHYGSSLILKDLSLNISKNKTVAFVGESGSGKTTLVNIISGLLRPTGGEYFINGISSEEVNLKSLQRKIGYITQDPVIFNDTLFNNVTFWENRNPTTERKFWEAVKMSQIESFIQQLPDKENTVLSNSGSNLSGGQKQRLSIARELYKNCEILILDEATSALDSETERSIQENIDQLKGQFTILIIAHRISTIKNADEIVLMKRGEISARGDFYELQNKSQYFKKLVELQEV